MFVLQAVKLGRYHVVIEMIGLPILFVINPPLINRSTFFYHKKHYFSQKSGIFHLKVLIFSQYSYVMAYWNYFHRKKYYFAHKYSLYLTQNSHVINASCLKNHILQFGARLTKIHNFSHIFSKHAVHWKRESFGDFTNLKHWDKVLPNLFYLMS